MQVRGLLVAVILLASLGGLVWWSNKQEKEKEGKPAPDAPPKIVEVAEADFQQLEISRPSGEKVVLKREGAGWRMIEPQAYATDEDAVKNVLTTLGSLASERLVEENAGDLGGFGLGPNSLRIRFAKKDGKSQTLVFGDDTPTGGSVYAMLDGEKKVYTIASYTKTSLDKTVNDLRDKRLLTFNSDKLTRVEINAGSQPIEFGRNNQNEWQIVAPTPARADSWQVEEVIRKLREAKMDLTAPPEELAKAASGFASAKPVATAKVTDAAGAQTIEVRKGKEDEYFAKSSAIEGFFKVSKDLGEGLAKTFDDFRNKKLFDFGFTDPTRFEVKMDGKTFSYQKSAEKWQSGGKAMDAATVQAVVDRLRDLSAMKFVDAGFTAPKIEIVVVSNEGKRTEKALVSQDGNRWIARRDGEPALYEIDSKAVEDLRTSLGSIKEAGAKEQTDKKK